MVAPPVLRPDRLPLLPATGAVAAAWLALTPSLLPRPALLQGALCAVAALFGYAVGAVLGWVLRTTGLGGAVRRLTGTSRRRVRLLLCGVAVAGTVAMLVSHLRWQRELRDLVGVEPVGLAYVAVIVLAAVAGFGLLLVMARALRAAGRRVGTRLSRVLSRRVTAVLGALVVAVAGYALIDSVREGRLGGHLDGVFALFSDELSTDVPAPTSEHLSGGPGSLITWEEIGQEGRDFIANAPSSETISEFSGRPAEQPVRAYIGVGSSREVTLHEQARLVVAELERAGGFERSVINIATATGRGWVNENQIRALEYIWDGDTATVSMQYSYLPSWMSFLVDGQRVQEAGRLLFEAVYARWSELPSGDPPLLVVSGESLGSFGGEAAFSGAQDLARRTSGALFVGPAGGNRLWSQFTAERDSGTPQILPVHQGGQIVRFSDDGECWPGDGPWPGPRVGYLQHANDPVTWLSGELVFGRPDWLTEERGPGVLPQIRWIPVVTALQLTVDQLVANDVPDGQGHAYGQAPVRAWAQILPSPGWTDADTERLVAEIARQQIDEAG